MVDALVSLFLERLLNTLADQASIVNEFRDQFEILQNELELMQSFLKEADKQKRKDERLRKIMNNMQGLVFEAEDILADCQLQSREDDQFSNGWLKCLYPTTLQFRYQTGKKLRDISEKIQRNKENMKAYLGPQIGREATRNDQMSRWSSPVYDHTQVVGLEGDAKKIKDWLFEGDNSLLEIGIAGMGGLGKTTVAKKVYDDREVEDFYERRMWVDVSQRLDEGQIMRSILRTLGDASVGDNCGELLKKINQYLLGKRYLIVMDDVWSQDTSWWHRLLEGLPKGTASCIIITTRNEEVARKMGVVQERIHWPKFLSKPDSWLLFGKIAFAASGGICVNPELLPIGEEIVEKCKGLPLAIKAIGGLLLYKSHYREWKCTLENFRDELAENDSSVMASLQLSYDELPSYLKSCFLSFSLYPEDCVISKDQLVRWWIGEGFVPQRVSGRSATEAGEDCFSGLTNRCLVEVVDRTYNGVIYTCRIHDMVRDLVIKTAADDKFLGPHHIGIYGNMDDKKLAVNQKLRALLSTTKTGEVNKIAISLANKFSECRYLRVLDVCKSIFEVPLTGLLYQISSLQHLTYLSLSNTHPLIELPSSLEKLSNLQILDVSYCQNLKLLPPCLITFTKLKVLDASHCGSLEFFPKGLGKLSYLEVLLGFRPAGSNQSKGCRMTELKNFTRLRSLSLYLTRSEEIGDNEVNALVNLQELQFLQISCFVSHGNDLINQLEKFHPPRDLHELCLKFYPGITSPVWLNPVSLPFLRYISISSGNLAEMHQCFWGEKHAVWKTEGLMLESLADLEIKWKKLKQVMPCLRIVNVSWCPNLVEFPVEEVGFRGGVWRKGEQNN